MPEYTAICTACGKEQDYRAPVADRDRAMRRLKCCWAPFTRRMYGTRTKADIAFAPGKYDIGLGGPQQFETMAHMQKVVDNHNRQEAKKGKSGIRIKRERR